MYRHVDAMLLRAAVDPVGSAPSAWPDLTGGPEAHPERWRAWLAEVWSRESFADAVAVASPLLAVEAGKVLDGRLTDSRQVRRVVLSTSRYVLRMTGRATPFGLFSGVAAVRVGERATVRWGERHRPLARPDAAWLAAAVSRLEACPGLLPRLRVVVNDMCFPRGDRLVVPSHRQAGDGDDRRVEASVRRTRAVAAVLRYARTPIPAGDLAARLAADFPSVPGESVDRLTLRLVRSRVLLTELRPPMTVTDPLAHVVARLDAAGADVLAPVAELARDLRAIRRDLERHNHASEPRERRELRGRAAARMRAAGGPAQRPITVDLRLDTEVVLPASVAREAEAAARALARLTPHPAGLPAWGDYHSAFLARYGAGAAVRLLELVNPDTGLGLPAGYRGSARPLPAAPLSRRDQRLLVLVQRAVMDGGDEIVLDERAIDELGAEAAGNRQVPPHAELFLRIDAASAAALARGEFELVVTGAARAAGTSTGRFLAVLDPPGLARARRAYAGLPTVRAGALPVQVSCPPVYARSEGVARAPALLPHVIRVSEYPAPDDAADGVIPLADLAVVGDEDGLCLVSLSRRRVLEPTAPNSMELRDLSHPLARFLGEIARARAVVYMPFAWGAARSLPFLPRLRLGRVVLAPARWNLPAADLPAATAPWAEWRDGLAGWRRRFRLPGAVYLAEGNTLLPLDLAEDAHLVMLRSRLDRDRHAVLHEAPRPEAYGWSGGRAHEVIVPLASTVPPLSAPSIAHVVPRDHGALPGRSARLCADLYTHPDRHTDLLARVPDLLAAGVEIRDWWYLDPGVAGDRGGAEPRLRLVLRLATADAYGRTVDRVGEWAAECRALGLLGRLRLDTYHPETGRYGSGEAMDAAESVFAADSAAALTARHMAAGAGLPLAAVTAAGLVDLAVSFAGGVEPGARSLVGLLPRERVTVDRALHDAATRLADPAGDWAALRVVADGDELVRAWCERRRALAAYRARLDGASASLSMEPPPLEPLSVLPSLLGLHHLRVHGPDPESERLVRRLSRAAAQRILATGRATAPSC